MDIHVLAGVFKKNLNQKVILHINALIVDYTEYGDI